MRYGRCGMRIVEDSRIDRAFDLTEMGRTSTAELEDYGLGA